MSTMAQAVLRWQRVHGRHDLPWQNTRDPYRVWLSEIMLQQTQVVTVRDYFARFVQRFPDVNALAQATLDEVLGLWSGLGYYSRARNLHRCAQAVVQQHGGVFPPDAAQLQTLPGIGRSTAAAIASLCYSERVAILDGNVKRVVSRYLGFEGDLAQTAQQQRLWQLATDLLPVDDGPDSMPTYTQGMMDLGATLCTTKKPDCPSCPLQAQCRAHALGRPEAFPVKTRKLKRSAQSIWLLWAQTDDGAVWLSRRPTPGVWAGLHCLSLFDDLDSLHASLPRDGVLGCEEGPTFKHVLTHKDLHLHPVRVRLARPVVLDAVGAWVDAAHWPQLGLPAPIRKLLASDQALPRTR